MTTITREHMELAALAAGMTPVRMSDDGRGLLVAEQAEPCRCGPDGCPDRVSGPRGER